MPCSKFIKLLKNGTVIFIENFTYFDDIQNLNYNNNNNNYNNTGNSFYNFNNSIYNNNYNNSIEKENTTPKCLGHAPILNRDVIIQIIVLLIMGIASLIGNIATIWSIKKKHPTQRNSRHSFSAINFLLYHLSIADLFVTAFCIFGDAGWKYSVGWLAGDFICKFIKFLQMFSLYLSTYVSILIGLDRWIAIKYPMKKLSMTKRYHRLLAGTYILSFILSIPQVVIFKVVRGPFFEEFYQCVTPQTYTNSWQEQLYAIFTLLFNFVIPLILIIASYASIFNTISGSEKGFEINKTNEMNNRVQSNRQKLIHRAKRNSLRISIAIVTAFLICWAPYYITMLTLIFLNPNDEYIANIQLGIFFFGMSNSVVNPLIYGAFQLMPHRKDSSTHTTITRETTIYRRTNKSSVSVSVSDSK